MEAVTAEWERRNLDMIDEKKGWVERMLGPEPTNRQSRQRPFLWQATDSDEWKGEDPNTAGVRLSVTCIPSPADVATRNVLGRTLSWSNGLEGVS